MAEFPEDSEEYKLLGDRLKAGCAAQSRQIDKTKIGENVKTLGTICKQFQHIEPDDTEEEKARKKFYNSILADKKPYFFRYKYKQLSKDYNAYIKKTDQNARSHLYTTLEDLLEKEKMESQGVSTLTEEEKTFLFYYRKNLPVIDSDCVMNKICKYIESIDFHIKQKIKTKQDFDYKILLSDSGFEINKKIYEDIYNIIEKTFKEWEAILQDREKTKYDTSLLPYACGTKTDKEFRYQSLMRDLEEVTSNEEQLTNHLVYLFYVGKPSYSKATLWNLVGKQIYKNILNKKSMVYYPVKDVNGDINFMFEKYSVRHISTESLKEPEKYNFNNYILGQEIFLDNNDKNNYQENYQFDKCFSILPKTALTNFKKIVYPLKSLEKEDIND